MGEGPAAVLVDEAGNVLTVLNDGGTFRLEISAKVTAELPVGTKEIGSVKQGAAAALAAGWPIILSDAAGNPIVNQLDAIDSTYHVPIVGKVTVSPPETPPAAVRVSIFTSDADLELNGAGSPDDQTYTITNGKTFTLQTVSGGAQGDPTESGSRIDVLYEDGGASPPGSEHLIARIYIVASTNGLVPLRAVALDGTSLDGDGSTKKIILRRIRLSNGNQELFGLVVGHEI